MTRYDNQVSDNSLFCLFLLFSTDRVTGLSGDRMTRSQRGNHECAPLNESITSDCDLRIFDSIALTMVSTRPSPAPAKGRVAYPSASNYVAGDQDQSPTLLDPEDPKTDDINNDTDGDRVQGLKLWWKSFRDRTEPETSSEKGLAGRESKADSTRYSCCLWGATVSIHQIRFRSDIYRRTRRLSIRLGVSFNAPMKADGSRVIPVVVAKCGLYLKENGTEVEGAFRISGSTKRMKDLQAIFDTGPKVGANQ